MTPGTPLAAFNITGVAAAYARLLKDETRTVLSKPKVSITFSLSSSGLIDVSKAEAAIEMMETYEEVEIVPANASNSNYTQEELDANAAAVEEAKAAASANATAEGAQCYQRHRGAVVTPLTAKVKVSKERKRLHYVTLKVGKTIDGPDGQAPITKALIDEAIERNAALLRAEQLRRINAEAKNALESFIIDTRGKMYEEGVESVSTEEERSEISSTFEAAEDWLYEDGKSLDASAYKAKQKALSGMTAPIFLRYAELEARPKAASQAREAVNWTQTILETWAAERPGRPTSAVAGMAPLPNGSPPRRPSWRRCR